MYRVCLLILLLAVCATAAPDRETIAEPVPVKETSKLRWCVSLGPEVGIPAGIIAERITGVGIGASMRMTYDVTPEIAVGFAAGIMSFTSRLHRLMVYPLETVMLYRLDGTGLRGLYTGIQIGVCSIDEWKRVGFYYQEGFSFAPIVGYMYKVGRHFSINSEVLYRVAGEYDSDLFTAKYVGRYYQYMGVRFGLSFPS